MPPDLFICAKDLFIAAMPLTWPHTQRQWWLQQEPKALTRSPSRRHVAIMLPATMTLRGSHMRLVILALGLVVGSCSRDVPNMTCKAERTVQGQRTVGPPTVHQLEATDVFR